MADYGSNEESIQASNLAGEADGHVGAMTITLVTSPGCG